MDNYILKFNTILDKTKLMIKIQSIETIDHVYIRANFYIKENCIAYLQKPIPRPKDQIDQRRLYDAAMSFQAYITRKLKSKKSFIYELLETANESIKLQDYAYVTELCKAMLFFDEEFPDAKSLLSRVKKEYETFVNLMGKEFTHEKLINAMITEKALETEGEKLIITEEEGTQRITASWNKIKRVFDSDIKNALKAFHYAFDLSKKGEFDKAIKEYEKSIKYRNDFGSAYLNLGVLLSRQNQAEKAIENYNKALENGIDSPYLYYNFGIAYSKLSDYDNAVRYYEKAIKKAPKYQKAIDNLIEILLNTKSHTDKLLKYCERLKELNPKYKKPYIIKYQVYMDIKDYKKAVSELSGLINIEKDPLTIFNIGVLKTRLEELNDAIDNFEICSSRHQSLYKDCLYNIILIYYHKKDFFLTNEYLIRLTKWIIANEGKDNAFESYEMILEKLDKPIKLAYSLARLYLEYDETEAGINKLKEIISSGYDFIPALELLAGHYQETGLFEEAISMYKEIIQIDKRNEKAFLNLGIILADQGEYQQAVHYWKMAIDINPNLVEAHYRLGLSYAQLNLMTIALEEFNIVLRLDPKYPKIRDRINLIRKSMYVSDS